MHNTMNIFNLIKLKESLFKSVLNTFTYNLIFSKKPLSIADQKTLDSHLSYSLARIIKKHLRQKLN